MNLDFDWLRRRLRSPKPAEILKSVREAIEAGYLSADSDDEIRSFIKSTFGELKEEDITAALARRREQTEAEAGEESMNPELEEQLTELVKSSAAMRTLPDQIRELREQVDLITEAQAEICDTFEKMESRLGAPTQVQKSDAGAAKPDDDSPPADPPDDDAPGDGEGGEEEGEDLEEKVKSLAARLEQLEGQPAAPDRRPVLSDTGAPGDTADVGRIMKLIQKGHREKVLRLSDIARYEQSNGSELTPDAREYLESQGIKL